MALARTTITLDPELLARVDDLCGPRGRSAFISEAIEARVKRERLRWALDATRGLLVGTASWQTPEESYRWVREQRIDRDES